MHINEKWIAGVALSAILFLAAGGLASAKGKPTQGPTDIKLVAEGDSEVTALFDMDTMITNWGSWYGGDAPDLFFLGYGSLFSASDQQTMAADDDGNVYLLYHAREDEDTTTVLMEDDQGSTFEASIVDDYATGILRWNAASDTFTPILEVNWAYPNDATPALYDWDRYTGAQIYSISIVPTDATKLPAGHLVVTRWSGSDADAADEPDDVLEVVLVDPSGTNEEEVLYTWPAGYNPFATTDITADGIIYLQGVDIFDDEARGAADRVSGEIFRLVPSGSSGSYTATAQLLGNSVGFDLGVAAGPGGEVFAYTGNGGQSDGDIYVYDPADTTPAWVDYAGYRQSTCCLQNFNAWAFDVDGAFWLAGRDSKQGANFISEVEMGGTASWSNRVARAMHRGTRCLEGDPGGGLLVLHDDYQELDGSRTFVTTTVYHLTPGDGGGGGGGGGNGKGKNK